MEVLGGLMSVLIYSTHSENIREMYDNTYPNKQKYAKQHGYELFSKDWKYGDWKPLLEEFRDLLKCYDYILAIDCDSIFTNHSIRVEDKVDAGDNRIVIAEEYLNNDPVNGGVIIWNNSPVSLSLLDQIERHIDQWKDHQTNIQGYLSRNLSTIPMRVVPARHMNATTFPSRNGKHPTSSVWHKGDWIFHPYAYSYQKKISHIKETLSLAF
jgi:hypothetical protein